MCTCKDTDNDTSYIKSAEQNVKDFKVAADRTQERM